MILLIPPAAGSSFNTLGEKAAEYFASPASLSVFELLKSYIVPNIIKDEDGNDLYYDSPEMRKNRFDLPKPVVLKLEIPAEYRENLSAVSVSCHPKSGGKERTVPATLEDGIATAEFYNLYTGCEYIYSVKLHYKNETVTSADMSFRTEDSVRFLSIDGLLNVRDLGAWATTDGRRVKQGMAYRGIEADGLPPEPTFLLTEKGKEEIAFLGIRTDIDLRGEGIAAASPLGENVRLSPYGVDGYTGALGKSNYLYGRMFKELAREETYPFYVHCTYGADRTGTFCALLEALLGVSEEDIIREYELTGLVLGSVSRELSMRPDFMPMLDLLRAYPGKTLREKAENYAKEAGVSEKEIQAIQELLLE